jgi:formamidopyrimidine-DNA glycosylase
MPELPDLEVIKEYLEGVLPGQRVQTVQLLRPIVMRNLTSEDVVSSVVGKKFVAVRRRGKFLIFDLERGEKLVVNPMLAGRLQYCPRNERRKAKTFLVLHLSGGLDLRYVDDKTMGKIYLTRDPELIPGFSAQGPDALDPQLTLEAFQERLRRRRGEMKGVLTNQTFVAGIGNAYADEILFHAGLYPFRKRPSLTREEIKQLYHAIRSVLSEAIINLRDRMRGEIHIKVRDFLQVHGKGGSPCPCCGTVISETRARGRLTNFCRYCQPRRMIGG